MVERRVKKRGRFAISRIYRQTRTTTQWLCRRDIRDSIRHHYYYADHGITSDPGGRFWAGAYPALAWLAHVRRRFSRASAMAMAEEREEESGEPRRLGQEPN